MSRSSNIRSIVWSQSGSDLPSNSGTSILIPKCRNGSDLCSLHSNGFPSVAKGLYVGSPSSQMRGSVFVPSSDRSSCCTSRSRTRCRNLAISSTSRGSRWRSSLPLPANRRGFLCPRSPRSSIFESSLSSDTKLM